MSISILLISNWYFALHGSLAYKRKHIYQYPVHDLLD